MSVDDAILRHDLLILMYSMAPFGWSEGSLWRRIVLAEDPQAFTATTLQLRVVIQPRLVRDNRSDSHD